MIRCKTTIIKIALTIALCSLPIFGSLLAQEQLQRSTCARTLQLAQSVYQKGDLHKIPALLEDCLNTNVGTKTGFTKQEKVEALKILALSHIYREEPKEADEAMLGLLRTDNFFTINEALDPEEFIALYKTFRTYHLFSGGIKIGTGFILPNVNNIFHSAVTGNTKGTGTYSPVGGIQVGLSFEMPLFRGYDTKKSKWIAASELWYINSNFTYNDASLTKDEATGEPNSNIEAIFNQQRLQFNLMMHYKIGTSNFNPYVGLGAGIGYLLMSSGQVETQFSSTNNVITGPSINFTPNFNAMNIDAIASIGVSFHFGSVLITADLSYQQGLLNASNEKLRINTEAAIDYGFVVNDFTQNNIMMNLGFAIPYFSPRKLTSKKGPK